MSEMSGELLMALATASAERQAVALKVLKGEVDPVRRPSTGPMLMQMGQAAALLGVSRPTLWRMMKAGALEKVEIYHGAFRVRRADVEAIAERGGVEGKSA